VEQETISELQQKAQRQRQATYATAIIVVMFLIAMAVWILQLPESDTTAEAVLPPSAENTVIMAIYLNAFVFLLYIKAWGLLGSIRSLFSKNKSSVTVYSYLPKLSKTRTVSSLNDFVLPFLWLIVAVILGFFLSIFLDIVIESVFQVEQEGVIGAVTIVIGTLTSFMSTISVRHFFVEDVTPFWYDMTRRLMPLLFLILMVNVYFNAPLLQWVAYLLLVLLISGFWIFIPTSYIRPALKQGDFNLAHRRLDQLENFRFLSLLIGDRQNAILTRLRATVYQRTFDTDMQRKFIWQYIQIMELIGGERIVAQELTNLANSHLSSGNYDRAIELAEGQIRIRPGLTLGYLVLAQAYLMSEPPRTQDAFDILDGTVEKKLTIKAIKPYVQILRGVALAQWGRTDDAIQEVQKGLKTAPPNDKAIYAELLEMAAWIHAILGEKNRAEDYLQQAHEQNPHIVKSPVYQRAQATIDASGMDTATS
jgi:tetratricopeptide (TPR) repeat protein